MLPLIGMPGTWEMVIILAIVILIFGAAKLPELARGTGQALRIFKAETKGLHDDEKDDKDEKDEKKAKPSGPAGELNAADTDVAEGEIVDERREHNA